MLNRGYIQIYTGNGKGKTTASLGLAFRAAGAGLKSIIIQFMKGQKTSEVFSTEYMQSFMTIEQYGLEEFILPEKSDISPHKDEAHKALVRAQSALKNDEFDIIILDEIITALFFTLISLDDILLLMKNKQDSKELILTGRQAPQEIIDRADLVTEMKEIKHYYNLGVQSRKGIEN